MTDASFSLTCAFSNSAEYRSFILRVTHLKSPHTPFFGVLQGQSRIYVRRNLNPREIVLTSHGNPTDILFDLRQWFDPRCVVLSDFSLAPTKDFLRNEYNHCLHACIQSSQSCFDHFDDPESFHQFRLDIRAFRSHLKIARKIGMAGLDELRERTKIMAQSSNGLRDADVRIGLYEKFGEPLPAALANDREQLLNAALALLQEFATDTWLLALRHNASIQTPHDSKERFVRYIDTQTKKAAKRWRKINMKEDSAVHALRIMLKMLSYGYFAIDDSDEEIVVRAKSVKAIQSRLGDVRDLRSFYHLPGLDQETRYRVVQKLSSLENELEEMEIK